MFIDCCIYLNQNPYWKTFTKSNELNGKYKIFRAKHVLKLH